MMRISKRALLTGLGCALLTSCTSPRVVSQAAFPEEVDESQACKLISAYRVAHGLSGLRLDPELEKAAAAQAMAMASTDTLSHTVAGSLRERLDADHIRNRAAAENVSAGYFTLADAIEGWRRSPPHKANLLDPMMRRMGIGSAYVQNSRFHVYWSLILAD
ncbi:MAG TPA: CAP domain-containing protein [Beijerinckiaceae bacterium]|nr:CAP domain-containing protein [Beijerinckiaceae bacterium]